MKFFGNVRLTTQAQILRPLWSVQKSNSNDVLPPASATILLKKRSASKIADGIRPSTNLLLRGGKFLTLISIISVMWSVFVISKGEAFVTICFNHSFSSCSFFETFYPATTVDNSVKVFLSSSSIAEHFLTNWFMSRAFWEDLHCSPHNRHSAVFLPDFQAIEFDEFEHILIAL